MYYVYILKSINNNAKTYIGCTGDLKRRLKEHNEGKGAWDF
jgi:putative endonuclease